MNLGSLGRETKTKFKIIYIQAAYKMEAWSNINFTYLK